MSISNTTKATRSIIFAACVALCSINLYYSKIDFDLRVLSAAIFALAIIPLIQWLNNGSIGFPSFEILCLALIPTESLPIIANSVELQCFTPPIIRQTAFAVIVFQCALLAGHMWRGPAPTTHTLFTHSLVSNNIIKPVLWLFAGATFYVGITTFYWQPPAAISGPMHGIASGVSIVSVYILGNRSGTESMSRQSRRIFYAIALLQCSILPLGLILVEAMLLLSVLVLGYCVNSQRIPWLMIACLISITTILHAGKACMREKYWSEEHQGSRLSISEVPAFYSEWFGYGLDKLSHRNNENETSDNNTLLKRASLFHMLCLVVEKSPDTLPFLNGETYADIPLQLVPRFFWSDKPQIHRTTHRLGIYYGIQDENTIQTTTIGFGFIAEAWANFGFTGCIMIGLALGYLHKVSWSATRQCTQLSPAGVLMIAFTAFSIETGQTLAVWLSSTMQALLALLALIIIYKRFLYGRAAN